MNKIETDSDLENRLLVDRRKGVGRLDEKVKKYTLVVTI